MRLRLMGLVIGVLTVGLVAACGGSDSTQDDGATPSQTGAEAPAQTGADAPAEDPTTTDPTANQDDQDPVAVVNDEEIRKEDYDRQMAQIEATYAQQGVPLPQGAELSQLRQQIMQQLVQQELVLQETEARNIEATDEEVQAEYDATLSSFPDEETFKQALEAEGLSQSELEELIKDNIRVQKLLDSVIQEASVAPPSEEELQALYEQASVQQELPPFEEVRAELEAEIMNQRETEVIQAFVQDLEANSEVEILVEL